MSILTPAEAAAEVAGLIDDPDCGTDFTVKTPTADVIGNVERTAEQLSPQTVRAILEPVSAEAAFRLWAIETRQGKRLYVKGSDAAKLVLGGTVTGGSLGRTYYIVGPPRPLDLGSTPTTIVCDVLIDIERPG